LGRNFDSLALVYGEEEGESFLFFDFLEGVPLRSLMQRIFSMPFPWNAWLAVVSTLNAVSLLIDITDVWRFAKGKR